MVFRAGFTSTSSRRGCGASFWWRASYPIFKPRPPLRVLMVVRLCLNRPKGLGPCRTKRVYVLCYFKPASLESSYYRAFWEGNIMSNWFNDQKRWRFGHHSLMVWHSAANTRNAEPPRTKLRFGIILAILISLCHFFIIYKHSYNFSDEFLYTRHETLLRDI